jgi:predicted adenine nucleotide alpha hydrolase (AANH) superfamily ATPase
MKPKILAHICCAPDAAYAIGLLQQDYNVMGFFSNSNIWPPEEYARRLEETRNVREILDFPLLTDSYSPEAWFKMTDRLKSEPERGRRCDICYAIRLDRTARLAIDFDLPAFTTVLSVSPQKKADVINRIGARLARKHGLAFLEADFKKKGGFQKSIELSRRYGLYRQNYCGCLYSRKDGPP